VAYHGIEFHDIHPYDITVPLDGFQSIFHHRNWRAKVSCDVDVNQSAGNMVM